MDQQFTIGTMMEAGDFDSPLMTKDVIQSQFQTLPTQSNFQVNKRKHQSVFLQSSNNLDKFVKPFSQIDEEDGKQFEYDFDSNVKKYKISEIKVQDQEFSIRSPSKQDTDKDNIPIQKWAQMQQKLKEEKFRITHETEIKQQLLKEVEVETETYYRTYLKVLEEQQTNNRLPKFVCSSDSKLFGNAATQCNQILDKLSSNPRLFGIIIKYHNNSIVSQSVKSLIQTVVHSFYDNVAQDSVWDQPVMKLLSDVIEYEIGKTATIKDLRWDKGERGQDTYCTTVLEEFSKRSENVRYTRNLYKTALFQITKIDKQLDIDPLNIAQKLKEVKEHKRRQTEYREQQRMKIPQQRHISILQTNSSALLSTQQYTIPEPRDNMAEYYQALLKAYDQNKITGSRKHPKSISDSLVKLLVFNEEQKIAQFMPLERKSMIMQPFESQVLSSEYRASIQISDSLLLSQSIAQNSNQSRTSVGNEVQKVLQGCIEKLRTLLNVIMDSIFKNTYTVPLGIRMVCKFIEESAKTKFPQATEQQIHDSVLSFLFNLWLIPQFCFHKQYLPEKIIKKEHDDIIELLQKIMRKLVKRQTLEDDNPAHAKLNRYIADIQSSVTEYLRELLNLQSGMIKKITTIDSNGILQFQKSKMTSSCIFLPMCDIQILLRLLNDIRDDSNIPADELDDIKWMRLRAEKALKISECEEYKVFGRRRDIEQGKDLENNQIYTLLLKSSLPKDIQVDYEKIYSESKNEGDRIIVKVKNVIKRVLIEVEDIQQVYSYWEPEVPLRRVLNTLDEIYTSSNEAHTKTHLAIKYLLRVLNLLPSEYNQKGMELLYNEMQQDLNSQTSAYETIFEQTRLELIRAKQCVKTHLNSLKDTLTKLKKERSRRQIYEFIEKTPIEWCITSPKTREGLYSYKAMRMRQNTAEEEDKIWVEQQKDCIHNAINLEFIKQIVGGGHESTPNKKSSDFANHNHCSDIRGFIEIFANLPEVRDAVITGEDKAGVKNAYFYFINPLIDHYLEKEDQETKSERQFVSEALEKQISRKIYDKIFPKERTYRDAGLYLRIKTLEWLNYQHLDISTINRVDEMWQIAAETLLQMENQKTSLEKLDAMSQCTKKMNDILKLTSLNDDAASADTTLPIMIYILLKAVPQRLYSNFKQDLHYLILSFVELFTNDTTIMSGQGYCLTQLKSATQWLEKFNPQLIGMENILYQKLITQKEIKYGIHYIKKRNRSERKTFDNKTIQNILQHSQC